jgi:hypothetical protein
MLEIQEHQAAIVDARVHLRREDLLCLGHRQSPFAQGGFSSARCQVKVDSAERSGRLGRTQGVTAGEGFLSGAPSAARVAA